MAPRLIENRYTISEVSVKTLASPSWIRKIESLRFLEPHPERAKGRRRYYTKRDLYIINTVLILRNFGFEFEEIRAFKDLEEELYEIGRKVLDATVEKGSLDERSIMFFFYPTLEGVLRLDKLGQNERIDFAGMLRRREEILVSIQRGVYSKLDYLYDFRDNIKMEIEWVRTLKSDLTGPPAEEK